MDNLRIFRGINLEETPGPILPIFCGWTGIQCINYYTIPGTCSDHSSFQRSGFAGILNLNNYISTT